MALAGERLAGRSPAYDVAMPVEVSEAQALWFRARRGHLAGPGAGSPIEAARAIIGAQSQQLPPSLLALSLRTKGRPRAAMLEDQLFGERPALVRTWGQRDTLFVYDPDDWATVVAARGEWQPGGRGGPAPASSVLDKALEVIRESEGPVTRTDLIGVAPRSYVRALEERARMAGMDPVRLVAGRLIWSLAHRGEVCVAGKIGTEQSYALRPRRFPGMKWPARPSAEESAAALARRYLSVYGPATARDVAHFFNAKVTKVRSWLATMDDELVEVECEGRKGLIALSRDARDLCRKTPADASKWPLRMLPLWDSLLMGHADKSWTVPNEAERKQVWRKGAYVAAVVLARGRIVATWTQKQRRRRLDVEVVPLSGWRRTKHAPEVKREARAIADHLGLEGVDVSVG